MAIAMEASRPGEDLAKMNAEKNHVDSAINRDNGQLKRIQVHEYTSPKTIKQAVAEIADTAVNSANTAPCSSAMKIIIGPATTGKAPIKPATPDPHLRPAKVIKPMNKGTKQSLSMRITDNL